MKLVRFGNRGMEKPGMVDSDGRIRDLSSLVPDIGGDALLPASIEKLRGVDPASLPVVPDGVRIGACVGQVGKFICIGANYRKHAEESGVPIPDEPMIFNKWVSAICGPDDDIIRPRGSDRLDWEVELGVVIGKPGVYIDEADALSHVAGYCVVNDVSERSFQFDRGGTWDKGKGCDSFGPIGPWLVTPDEAKSHDDMHMWLEVDGHRFQDDSTGDMIFAVPSIIAHVSQYMSLQPGDIISTGTPAGVGLGLKPPRYLQPGNIVTLGIEGLGQQRQRVIDAS